MLRTAPRIEAVKTAAGEMPVYLARPAGPAGARRPGLLVMQEIFGVNNHIQDVTRRFAGQGYVALAPDVFHRSGHWLSFGYDQFAEARAVAGTLNEDLVVEALAAGLDHLAAQPDVDPDRLGVVGYCFGGRAAFAAAVRLAGRVQAAAVYYGGGIVTADGPGLVDRAGHIRCPVIAFFGALDRHIPREYVERLDRALAAAGVEHQVYCYPEADHGFFCDARSAYHPRSAQDAWHRTLWFFGSHLGPLPPVAWD